MKQVPVVVMRYPEVDEDAYKKLVRNCTTTLNIGTDKERKRVGALVIIHDDFSRLKWHLAIV